MTTLLMMSPRAEKLKIRPDFGSLGGIVLNSRDAGKG
jgi:hypothetical protein